MSMLEVMCRKFGVDYANDIAGYDIVYIQKFLARYLRNHTHTVLKAASNKWSQRIRTELMSEKEFQLFLMKQKRQGNWGQFEEACVLAEELGFNLRISYSERGKHIFTKDVTCTVNANAPCINLDNRDNIHWEYKGNTLGNGDCLYNAFAIAVVDEMRKDFRASLKQNQLKTKHNKHARTFDQYPLFFTNQIIGFQQRVEKQIKQTTMQNTIVESDNALIKRERKLSRQERQQIQADYQLALQLAAEEMEEAIRKGRFPG